ncbi:inositol monophosphatase family protein [Alkalicoccus urumqiensis]|uniref:inositol-phosphate phosphatase n=1 Tax=Alkalicoccus urumqiensis TaxID=1548213 RepID=A0A2P6MEP6_ALKUR|nr:inositol monophosphatase family protein [Alkalicoccus urumqiensis]PRO64762.1 inositol monophosphatase [Alkalicoccus urumqiensis]
MDRSYVIEKATAYIKEAQTYIKEKVNTEYGIDTKANKDDLVTDVDKSVEALFQQRINEEFPGHRLMGEEGSHENIHDLDGVVWILDPIDGTVNFVHMGTNFAISLGIFENGKPVYGVVLDVMNDEWFTAEAGQGAYLNGRKLQKLNPVPLEKALVSFNTGWMLKDEKLREVVRTVRGTRSYGSAAIELAYVAAGRLDAYISFHLAPWDIAGGCILIEETGGIATNYKGEPLDFLEKDTLFAANPAVYKELREALKITI